MLDAFVPVALLLGIGVLLGRARILPERAGDALNQVVLWVCLPAAILHHVPRLPIYTPERLLDVAWIALVPWALLLLSVIVVKLVVRALGLSPGEEGSLLMTVALGNTSFLGYPVIRALLGEEALATAVIYDQLGSFLGLATFGTIVLARYGGEETPTLRVLAQKVLRFPPFVALVVALLFGGLQLPVPAPIASSLELLATAMLPLVLMALGLGLKLTLPPKERLPLALGLGLKLLFFPALVLMTLMLTHTRGQAAEVALLESAMPPMVTAGALAAGQGLAPDLSRAMTGFGLVLALFTLPLFHWLAGSLL